MLFFINPKNGTHDKIYMLFNATMQSSQVTDSNSLIVCFQSHSPFKSICSKFPKWIINPIILLTVSKFTHHSHHFSKHFFKASNSSKITSHYIKRDPPYYRLIEVSYDLLYYLKLIIFIMIMFRAYFWPSSTAFSTRRFRRPSNVKSNETLPGENLGKLYLSKSVSFFFISGQCKLVPTVEITWPCENCL